MISKLHLVAIIFLVVVGLTYQSSSKTQNYYSIRLKKLPSISDSVTTVLIDSVRLLHCKVDSVTHEINRKIPILKRKHKKAREQSEQIERFLVNKRY